MIDTRTGAIAQFETEEDARVAGHDLLLTEPQAKELSGMSRQQRREWARQNANQAVREVERLRQENAALKSQLATLREYLDRRDKQEEF